MMLPAGPQERVSIDLTADSRRGGLHRLAAYAAPLRRHRVITHLTVAVTALAVAVGMAIPTAPVIQAGLQTAPARGIDPAGQRRDRGRGREPVVLNFPGPMDPTPWPPAWDWPRPPTSACCGARTPPP